MDDDLEQLRIDIRNRKLKQNERRAKKGKPPMHPELLKPKRTKRPSRSLPMPESGNIDDSAMSFEEWKAAGYIVIKGEKSGMTDIMGVPQFLMNQVRKINSAWSSKFRKK